MLCACFTCNLVQHACGGMQLASSPAFRIQPDAKQGPRLHAHKERALGRLDAEVEGALQQREADTNCHHHESPLHAAATFGKLHARSGRQVVC
jgi:hypothetical protein